MIPRKLSTLGESGLLTLIRRRFRTQKLPGLVLGPGDDAALFKPAPGRLLVATQDDLAEGTHFERRWMDFRRLAHKLLRINLSDLAAMGAVKPVGVLVTAAFPKDSPSRWATDFLLGLSEEARRFGVAVLGGNLSASSRLFFSMAALGEVRPGAVVRRSGARKGDWIAGIGPVGLARQGLEDLRRGRRSGRAVAAFWEPVPRFKAARVLAERRLATSLIDNSDGLVRSCALLAEESGLGSRLYLSPELERALRRDGEDYGLVFTVPRARWAELKKVLPEAYRLGEMVSKRRGNLLQGGFDHFRAA